MDNVLLKKEETRSGVIALAMFLEETQEESSAQFAAGFLFDSDIDVSVGNPIGYLSYVDEFYRDIEMSIRDFHSLVKKYGPVR